MTRARRIRLVLVDVDGVITDGRVWLDHRGRELAAFHARDRGGVVLLQHAGIRVALLARRRSAAVGRLARGLGVRTVVPGATVTLAAVRRLCRRFRLVLPDVAFVGNELADQPLRGAVGLAVATADAPAALAAQVQWTTAAPGGAGAIGDVAELLLRAQGQWATVLGEMMR